MTTIDTSTEQDQRAAAIAGLHELADFLASHPEVNIPHIRVSGGYRNSAALVAWIDDLDELRVESGVITSLSDVVRTFGGLDVPMTVDAVLVGEPREVPSTATELVPFTAEQIRERACTGERYLVNPHAPDEGTDIVHDGPCPVHADVEAVQS